MIQLPFTVDSPFATAVVMFVLTLIPVGVLYSYWRGHQLTRSAINWFVGLRFWPFPRETMLWAVRAFLIALAVIFFLPSLFGFSVATGLLKSKPRESITIEQFLEEHR